jgi:hypothetical protein
LVLFIYRHGSRGDKIFHQANGSYYTMIGWPAWTTMSGLVACKKITSLITGGVIHILGTTGR